MRTIPVDQAGFDYIRFIAAEPRMKYENNQRLDVQETAGDGTPLFSITCLAKRKGEAKPETITVKVAMAAAPSLEEFTKVVFANLVARGYRNRNDRVEYSFTADKLGKAREQ